MSDYQIILDALWRIAETPKDGEPCPEAPEYLQTWTDAGIEPVLDRLHDIIDEARAAIARVERGEG